MSSCLQVFFIFFLGSPLLLGVSALQNCSNLSQPDTASTQRLRQELRFLFGTQAGESRISDLIKSQSQCNSVWLSSDEISSFRQKIIDPLKNLKIALIVVDYQNDFVNGSLAVGTGDAQQDPWQALPWINRLVANPGVDQITYTQDWHPYNHISFLNHSRDPDRVLAPQFRNKTLHNFDVVQFIQPNITQRLYPSHCVPGTWGNQLVSNMTIGPKPLYIHKGTEPLVDSYSAFKNNNGKLLELDSKLKQLKISAFIACGLAYDICVRFTCADGAELGYLVAVSPDCSKGFLKDGIVSANQDFQQKNVAVISGSDAEAVFSRSFVPIEWAIALSKRIE